MTTLSVCLILFILGLLILTLGFKQEQGIRKKLAPKLTEKDFFFIENVTASVFWWSIAIGLTGALAGILIGKLLF